MCKPSSHTRRLEKGLLYHRWKYQLSKLGRYSKSKGRYFLRNSTRENRGCVAKEDRRSSIYQPLSLQRCSYCLWDENRGERYEGCCWVFGSQNDLSHRRPLSAKWLVWFTRLMTLITSREVGSELTWKESNWNGTLLKTVVLIPNTWVVLSRDGCILNSVPCKSHWLSNRPV